MAAEGRTRLRVNHFVIVGSVRSRYRHDEWYSA